MGVRGVLVCVCGYSVVGAWVSNYVGVVGGIVWVSGCVCVCLGGV